MAWTLNDLVPVLSNHEGWTVENNTPSQSLLIRNEDGVEACLAVAGEQIIAEVLLFAKSSVRDVNALNDEILRTHKMFPLSTIGINNIAGDDYYVAFGSLSSQSKEESVLIEIATLYRNVEAFIDLYEEFLGEA